MFRSRSSVLIGTLLAAILVVSAAGTVLAADPPPWAGRLLTASLSGPVEVPPGDPDGSGSAMFAVNVGQGRVCYLLSVTGIAPATAAHIHIAPVGVAGPVVIPLTAPTGGSSSGCVEVANRSLLRALIQDPGAYYVNVHNATYPAGAVRGQLSK